MATITKIELQQANTRLTNENAALRAQLSVLQAERDMFAANCTSLHINLDQREEEIKRITEVASALNAPRPFGGQETPRLKAMREAREMALATGRCIKV